MKPMASPGMILRMVGSLELSSWDDPPRTQPPQPPQLAPRHGAFGASTTRLEGSAIDAQQDGIGTGLVGGWWEVGLVVGWRLVGDGLVDKNNPKTTPTKKPVKGHVGFLGLWFGIFFFYWIWTPWMVFENCCWLDSFRKFSWPDNFWIIDVCLCQDVWGDKKPSELEMLNENSAQLHGLSVDE